MNVPISRDNNILNGADLVPSETVVTDSSSNLASIPYASTATPNSFALRDASGNASFNNVNGSTINAQSVAIQPSIDGTAFDVKDSSGNSLINVDTGNDVINIGGDMNFAGGASISTVSGDARIGGLLQVSGNSSLNGQIKNASLTANRVLISDAGPHIISSGVTSTTLGFLDATSSVQGQLNGKQATITGAASSIVSSNLTPSVVAVSDGSGKVASSAVSTTTLGYVDATSSIQTQLNGKQPLVSVGNNKILETDSSGNVIGSTSLPSATSAANMNLSGTTTMAATTTPGTILAQFDASNHVVAYNQLPSGCTYPNPFLTGTITTPLTASQVVQTDGSSHLTASNTLTGMTLAGTTNVSGLTASTVLQLDVSKNIISSNTEGYPGSHSVAAPAPSGSTNYWFIPLDPNNPSNSISSSSPTPPRSVRIVLKNVQVTGTASNIVLRFAQTAGAGVTNTSYSGVGVFATSSGSGSTNVQNSGHNTSTYTFIFTGSTLATTSFLSGYLDISWYVPGSGTAQATVTGIVGCFDGGSNTQQTIHGTYTNTIAAMNQVVGISLFLTASGSPLFSTACSADVVTNRL